MKLLCKQTCQVIINDKITLVERDTVIDMDENPYPRLFVSLDGKQTDEDGNETNEHHIDFSTAGEAELIEDTKWTYEDAKAAMQLLYGEELKKEEGDKRKDLAAKILDIRFRSVDVKPNQ